MARLWKPWSSVLRSGGGRRQNGPANDARAAETNPLQPPLGGSGINAEVVAW